MTPLLVLSLLLGQVGQVAKTVVPPGANALQAQAVQGVDGGVPMTVTCTNCATTINLDGGLTVTVGSVAVDGGNVDVTDRAGRIVGQITDGTNAIGTSAHPFRTDPTGTTAQPVYGQAWVTGDGGTFGITDGITKPCICNKSVPIAFSGLDGGAKLITGVAGQKVYACIDYVVTDVAGALPHFIEGTGTNCGSNQGSIDGAMPFGANGGISVPAGPWGGPFEADAGADICVTTATPATLGGRLTYCVGP